MEGYRDLNPRDVNGQVTKVTWRIENFSRIKDKKLCSEIFTVDGNKWRLIIYPRGTKGKNLGFWSIFFAVADSATLPSGWSRYAHFGLAVIDQFHRENSKTLGSLLQQWHFYNIDKGITFYGCSYLMSNGYLILKNYLFSYKNYHSIIGEGSSLALKGDFMNQLCNSVLFVIYLVPSLHIHTYIRTFIHRNRKNVLESDTLNSY